MADEEKKGHFKCPVNIDTAAIEGHRRLVFAREQAIVTQCERSSGVSNREKECVCSLERETITLPYEKLENLIEVSPL